MAIKNQSHAATPMKTKMKSPRPKPASVDSLTAEQFNRQPGTVVEFPLRYLALAVGLITFIVYLPALRNGFVDWDDMIYVVKNPHLRSLDGDFFQWAFFDYATNLWHPLTWTSHALDFALWGANPLGHHLTNVILHAVNTAIVIQLSVLLLQSYNDARRRSELTGQTITIAAGIAGLLFGLHPIHVESVAWVAERKDLLYSLFYMMSIMAYLRFGRDSDAVEAGTRRINRFYFFSLGWFALSLCSKPMAVTLPVILIILDWYPLERFRSGKALISILLEKIPFIALSAGVSLLTIMAQKAAGGLAAMQHAPMGMRTLVAVRALMMYLWNLVAPVNLLPYYPYPSDVSLGTPVYPMALLLVLSVTAACCYVARHHRVWFAVWVFFIVTLAPVLGFVQAGSQAMADRFVYLPSLGPFLLMGIGCALVWEQVGTGVKHSFFTRRALAGLFCVISLSMAVLTVKQTGIWKNTITLWEYNLKKAPGAGPEAYYLRGTAFRNDKQFDRALEDFSKVISMAPTYFPGYLERGGIFLEQGLYDRAIEDESKAISLDAGLVNAYVTRGKAYLLKGDPVQSFKDFEYALALNPGWVTAYGGRGDVYSSLGEWDKAIADYSKALSLLADLDDVHIYISRGDAYLKKGANELAIRDYQTACNMGNFVGCVKTSLPQ